MYKICGVKRVWVYNFRYCEENKKIRNCGKSIIKLQTKSKLKLYTSRMKCKSYKQLNSNKKTSSEQISFAS